MIKLKLHSVVDVITNSSTVIYTYQNGCVEPAKELVNEMLKLSGITDKTADDIFYFGVFCDDDEYINILSEKGKSKPEDCPEITGTCVFKTWFDDIVLRIMKGEISKPDWMEEAESAHGWSEWAPESNLCLLPKDEKYTVFGNKISALLNSITADGGRDG